MYLSATRAETFVSAHALVFVIFKRRFLFFFKTTENNVSLSCHFIPIDKTRDACAVPQRIATSKNTKATVKCYA